jgi:pimeloyl-ACP methyl ester carboxylesterase
MDVCSERATFFLPKGRAVMMKKFATAAALAALTILAPRAAAVPAGNAAIVDPPRDAAFPAHYQQLLIRSHGAGMNALLFVASGRGPRPTVILMHGLPGNERNLDLAQAIRRAGWDVLTFTYRGAWGSPGDFSIANAMDDTAAALEFARSDAGAKLGIDTRNIVLAGHSMGGATAAMTAASASGLDGLILIDAWNPAGKTSRGADTREALAKGFDDFGNSLHGATPDSVAAEVIAMRSKWDLVAAAPRLANVPILSVSAKFGLGQENARTTAAIRQAGNRRVTAVEMDTDHSFSDHRVALSSTIVRWLTALPLKR